MFFSDRDVQHNISFSTMENNKEGGLLYMSAGEVNPVLTVEKNRIKNNCRKFYGNFTTCQAAVEMDVQNTESIFFRVGDIFCISFGCFHSFSFSEQLVRGKPGRFIHQVRFK